MLNKQKEEEKERLKKQKQLETGEASDSLSELHDQDDY